MFNIYAKEPYNVIIKKNAFKDSSIFQMNLKLENIDGENDNNLMGITVQTKAFNNSYNFAGFTGNYGIMRIDTEAFVNCVNLKEIVIDDDDDNRIDKKAFKNCKKTENKGS